MTLEYRIQVAEGLTPVELEIGTYVIKNKEQVADMTIVELAEYTHVSKSSVHRFCKKLGFEGFNDLKVAAVKDLANQRGNQDIINVNYPFERSDGPLVIADKLANLYKTAIQDTRNYMDPFYIQQIVSLLHRARVIDIYTHGHNLNAAENFKDKMNTFGRKVNCPTNYYEQSLTALAAREGHVALILSYSGKATFIEKIAKKLSSQNIPMIIIGKSGCNKYPEYIQHVLYISGKEKLRNRISQFSSHIAMQYILDVLFSCIYNKDRTENIAYLKKVIDFMDDRSVADDE